MGVHMSAKSMASKLLHTAAMVLVVAASGNTQAAPLNISDIPLFLNPAVPPLNMIILGRDHKLYYEAYNDASDLNNDGVLDTKYKGYELKSPAPPAGSAESIYKIDYFGYFDSKKCYSYTSGVWDPVGPTGAAKTCPGTQWSGDFLNYLTTSRIDALRKVMYGGDRSTDTTTDTILERSYIPQDAHSWGKDYEGKVDGYDISDYSSLSLPTAGTRHFFANTTIRGTDAAAAGLYAKPPLLRVAQNVTGSRRVWNWVSKERPVADSTGTFMDNGTNSAGVVQTGFPLPAIEDYTVRVRVCKKVSNQNTIPLESNCKRYPDNDPNGNYKPIGIIQEYGEGVSPRMYFGLMTGSYARNTSGGVLRRNMGKPANGATAADDMSNEIDPATGMFIPTYEGIIATFNRLHGTGFSASNASNPYAYDTAYGSQQCGWITSGPLTEGKCQMWGNPIAEIMFESLRYFAAPASGPLFATSKGQGEEGQLPGGGPPVASWTDPYASPRPKCAKPFQTVISDINPTYDTDQLPGGATSFGSSSNADLPGLDVSKLGQDIWNGEFGVGTTKDIFIGEVSKNSDGTGGELNSAPTVKKASSFGNIRGLAPEDPTKQGGYYSASVAYYGHEHDLSSATGDQKLTTFAVALASPLPRIEIPLPGGKITLVPFAKSVAGSSINAGADKFQPTNQIVDFYVDSLDQGAGTGKFRVNFEDVEQGADHDMDAIVSYEYKVTGDSVAITLTSEYAAGGIVQHMGYVISGSDNDGIFLEVRDKDTAVASDVDYYLDTPAAFGGKPPAPATAAGWKDAAALPLAATRTFKAGSSAGATLLKDPLWYAAKWGGFEEAKETTDGRPDLQAEWDENKDGTPDNYFLVTNALNLGEQLSAAFDEIAERVGSASSASVNAGSISSTTRVYQAKFNSGDWTGQLLSFPVQTTGANIGTLLDADWEASQKLPIGSRKIITTNTDGPSPVAVAFDWDAIGTNRQAQLDPLADGKGQLRLNFLRGDDSHEKPKAGGEFRKRPSKLGDIVSSSPIFVGAPNFLYPDGLESAPYSSFVADNATRQTMVYAGANDGMLHAFDATTGVETLAFIPSDVFSNLVELTKPSYTHRFFVDGTPTVGDAFYGGGWHTVLVGGLNRGGRSIYALDVTNPGTFSEGNASTIRRWEFTDADLGYTYSRPAIVRMANGVWAAVFGSGYHTTALSAPATGHAYLYIVDIATGGSLMKVKIDTTVGTTGTPNGLATPALVDINGDSIVDYAYAGDLRGNMWKFDLTSTTSSNWDVAFISGGVKSPLFVAKDAGGVRQPITSKPEVGRGPKGAGTIVLFGTGKFMEVSDKASLQSGRTQSFYGVVDRNAGLSTDIVSGRSVMTLQRITDEGPFSFQVPDGPDADNLPDTISVAQRVTTNNPLASPNDRGWYLDLLSPNTPNFQGEMQVSDSVLRNGRVIFTTLIPDPDLCSTGGTSWLMEINALTGSRLEESPFDNNRDGQFSDDDFVEITLSDGSKIKVPVSGLQSEVGIAQRPGILSSENAEFKYLSGTAKNSSDSNIQRAVENPGPNARGRQSWRQIK
jgi:type IV pilus assembly protein PilY1